MEKRVLASNIMLVTAAMIWGFSFVFQRAAMEHIGPFTFNACRYLLGALSLIPVIRLNDQKIRKKSYNEEGLRDNGSGPVDVVGPESHIEPVDAVQSDGTLSAKELRKIMILGSLTCGFFNWAGSILVQVGLVYTAASKAAFIGSLYIVVVPIIGIFFKKKTTRTVWFGVVIAVLGLYFLCITEGFYISFGDLVIFMSTFFFAIHIHLIGMVAIKVDGIRFVRNEAFFSVLWSSLIAFVFEDPNLSSVIKVAIPLIFSGILAVGVAYALQVTAQKYTNPDIAALLMSSEAFFGAIGGVLFLQEILTPRELLGGILVMAAVIIAQLPKDFLIRITSLIRK
ncbi:MAG TPA: DMT family transporter [Bacillota bacterium]|jgi:drug/metabolite transporter (DMT)-like permease|nr:DMT family transporter [Bacillota bacterium]HPZ59085.1 DMT family transporter [Bacillota bacterium]HQC82126.1 DMT family transporter [Bacillota bacterium]